MMEDRHHIFLNSILYVANQFNNRTIDIHKLFKILYFAEQKHLVKYGNKIVDDTFVALPKGPVPTHLYDIVKAVKANSTLYPTEYSTLLQIKGMRITSLAEADLDWLSQSEIESLDESISENGNLNFFVLTDKSHDAAWQKGGHMSSIDIAIAGGAHEDMVKYIKEHSENNRLYF